MENEFPFGTSQPGKRDYLFRISLYPGNFRVGQTKKNVYHLHPNRNYREFVVNGIQPIFVSEKKALIGGKRHFFWVPKPGFTLHSGDTFET